MEYNAMEQYWIWLSSIEGIGGKRFYRLIGEYGDAREVYERAGEPMRFIGDAAYKNLMAARNERYFYALFSKLERMQISVLTRLSAGYPERLVQIPDPPPTLYVRGNAKLDAERAIAVVGSRQATSAGRRAAEEFSRGLAEMGVCVVSGLARGIDSAAHRGCVSAGGHTAAVLGCGVDVVYPSENRQLYEDILASGGSIVSEYAPGAPPLASHFPPRNRIISGMCQGLLVVEGTRKSGAMITSNFALDQGRDVFSVPGGIYAPLSALPNWLLTEGAIPTLSHFDILEFYRWASRDEKQPRKSTPVELDPEEKIVHSALEFESLSFDELISATGIDSQKLNSLLTMLELRGIIEKAPGRIYSLR